MLQPNSPIKIQRERRVRQRLAHRKLRGFRQRIGGLRRILAVAVVLALVGIGAAVFFATRPAPEPEPILLGRGPAGILGKTAEAAAPPASPARRTRRAPAHADTGERGRNASSGEASYYGDELRGRPTASGESFNPEGYTAAHRTLPLGTRLRVTNLRNGESVVVRVNDRGPFSGDRVLDVSKGAARDLGMIGSGTTQVRMELLPSVRG